MRALLKRFITVEQVEKVKALFEKINRLMLPFFAKSSFLSSLYYCFFSRQFAREHQAVLQGRLRYQQSLLEVKSSSILLRRNTHRLEKGLIMVPRRDVFAENYIAETIACFANCLTSEAQCQDELKWAQDVLCEFFSVTGSSPVLDKARNKFNALTLTSFDNKQPFLPYQHQDRVKSSLSSEQLFDLFKQRRSVRWYQNKPVERLTIHKAIEMSAQAPSACNRQPFQFYVITDTVKAVDVAKIAMGTAGFAENIPALIVVVGNLSAYPKERDRHVIYIDGGLVAMQLMLAFETLGLSTCPINWPDIEVFERKMAKKLQLDKHLKPIMLIAVGYAKQNGEIPFSQKKNSSLLIKDVQ